MAANPFSRIVRKIASRMGVDSFDHGEAQEYERNFSEQWIRENFEGIYGQIEKARAGSDRWPGPSGMVVREFFSGDGEAWAQFTEHIADRTCLEVGGGPCAQLSIWWWPKRRIVVDPLVAEYRRLSLQMFGRTWFTEDMELHSQPAEDLIPALEGSIDGAIVCRNALDHCAEPMEVLRNLGRYAAPGCRLLLWTDLWHLAGHDEGHRNITRDREEFAKEIRQMGFDVVRSFEDVRGDGSTIEYGCRAVKRDEGA